MALVRAWRPKLNINWSFSIASCIRHNFYKIRGHDRLRLLVYDPPFNLTIDCLFDRGFKKHCPRFLSRQATHPTRSHGDQNVTDGQIDITTGVIHDVLWTNCVFIKWHDTTGDSSRSKTRQVGSEATRKVFPGSATGSRTYRSCSENEDDRPCWLGRPSVILVELRIKMAVMIRTAIRDCLDNNMFSSMPHSFQIISAAQEKNRGESWCPILF